MVAISLLLLKLQGRFRREHYFYFSLLLEADARPSLFGILYRTSIPLATGFVAGCWSIEAEYPESAGYYGLMTGLLTAFLAVWPSILDPKKNNPSQYLNRLPLLYLVRTMFCVLYVSFGFLGGQLAAILFGNARPSVGIPLLTRWLDPKAIANNLVAALVSVGLAFLYNRIQTRLQRPQ